jgi:hypothetical protein
LIQLTSAGWPVVLGICRPVEARCEKTHSVAEYVSSQIVGLAAEKGWNASRSLH